MPASQSQRIVLLAWPVAAVQAAINHFWSRAVTKTREYKLRNASA
jgi:hypothetical protein